MELQNFIGGTFVPSDSLKKIAKYSPFDGELLAEVTASDAMDVIKAIQSAKKAMPAFKELSCAERSRLLLKMAQALEDKASDYAYQEALHQGLPQSFVLENSVKVAVQILRQTAESLSQELPAHLLLQPVGVVGIVASWSLSLRLITERLAPALAAGNVCLIKVSEKSPITARILGEVLQAASVPAGVVNILQGDGEVGQIIAGHPSISAITAVGKTSTMESIAKAGLAQFKKMQLSGSVKNAAIVLAGTDFTSHMDEILQSFLIGQGQLCWNTSRLFVLESFHKEFIESLKTALDKLEPLKDPSGSSPWTPLISAEAVAEVLKQTQSGVAEHGKVAWGAEKLSGSGYFVKPAMMVDLPNCSVLQQDELRGPLFLVTAVKYQHEVAKWVNTSYLAHSAVIWGPGEKLDKVIPQLDCAQVWMNQWMKGEVQTVFGHKQSSFGNPDMAWSGSFYSDVKILTGIR